MDPRLERVLSTVAVYLRRVRFLWLLSAAWLVLAIVAYWMWSGGSSVFGGSQRSLLILLVTAGAAVIGAWSISQAAYRNSRALARIVESKFPSLRQRLLTSVQQPITRGRRGGFLQETLIDETLAHAALNDWRRTHSKGTVALAWIGQFLTLAAFLSLCGLILFTKSPTGMQSASSLPVDTGPKLKLIVEPGNAEVERGSNLVITARFSGGVPATVWLASQPTDSEEGKRQEMRRNLKDPVFGGYLVNIATDSSYRIEYPDGQSDTFQVKVFEFPMLVRSDAKIQPPEYTHQEAKIVEDTRRVSVIDGSILTWVLNVNKPLVQVRLVDEQGNATDLKPTSDNPLSYSTEMVMKESKRWKLHLRDDAGRASKIEEELVARVIPNKPPEIKLTRASDASVSPIEELLVGATITEDLGLRRYGITYNFASSPPIEIELTKPVTGNKKLTTEHMFEFESLKAEPDQLLSYHFWAEDYDRDGATRRVDSDMFFAEVRPFEEIFREGQAPPSGDAAQQQQQQQQANQNAQQAEQLAELQKKIITGSWNMIRRESFHKPSDKFVPDATVLAESQTSAIELLATAAERLTDQVSQQVAKKVALDMQTAVEQLTKAANESTVDLLNAALTSEQSAYQGLLRLRAREHEIVRQTQQQRQQQRGQQSNRQQQRQQQLDQLRLNNEQNRYQQEQQATPPQDQQQRETRQVTNRLAELAHRQEDLNRQLRELQSALEAAQTEQQKQDIEEQLKRLRDSQEEMLRDSDELLDRLNQEQNREQLAEAREQTEQARQNIRDAAQALSQNQPSQALSAGTRAQRQLEETENQLREQSANAFSQSMRNMVQEARELDERQQQVNRQLQGNDPQNPVNQEPGLRTETQNAELDKQLAQQRERLTKLLDEMQKTVTESEATEPLLADQLYDSFRKAKQENLEQRLGIASDMMRRGMEDPARTQSRQAGEGISQLREEVEQASQNVLGNDTERLRRANNDLQRAIRDLEDEMRRRTGQPSDPNQQNGQPGQPGDQQGQPGEQQGQPGEQQGTNRNGANQDAQQPDPNNPGQQPGDQSGQPQEGQQPGQQAGRGQQPGEDQQPGQRGRGQAGAQGQRGQQGQPGGQQPGQRQGQPNDGQPQNQAGQRGGRRGGNRAGGNQAGGNQGGGGGGLLDRVADENRGASPITGNDFTDWTDVLRDVEEIVGDRELSAEAARIREAAREFRRDFRRHGTEPQWPLVQKLVAEPLKELRKRVEDELLRRSAEKNAIVPIDRDPVPPGFEEALRKYYKNLGSGR